MTISNLSVKKKSGNGDILWIESDAVLEEFCKKAKFEPFIAVDTEFHRERTYFMQLALVQVATTEQIACIDPLAIGDLAPLDELLLDSGVLKLFHAGRQDLEIFFDRTGRVPGPIFDTQVAAALLGMGEQVGYSSLVEKVCGLSLSKAHVRTDWMRRPLDSGVISYAADDVRYLRDIYRTLDTSLVERERRSWLDEEQTTLCDPATYKTDTAHAWKSLKGSGKLAGISLTIAQVIAGWREDEARKTDRPKRWVISDEIIVNIARQRPHTIDSLMRIRGLEDSKLRKYGGKILDLISEAEKRPEATWPLALNKGGGRKPDDALTNALLTILQVQAKKNDMSASIIASRNDLQQAATGNRNLPLFSGWRSELAGDALLEFLDGELRIEMESGKLALNK